MFKIKAPTKKLKEICQSLGEPYIIKIIDIENVIYRNLNGIYDFEISGLNNQRQSFNATIYIWQLTGGTRVVETISDIKSLEDLTVILESIATKYLDLIKLS
jgi:hypothetical protein